MINRFEAVVESCDPRDSHAWLKLGRVRLAARTWDGLRRGATVAVRIPPDDVLLATGHPGAVSARNILPGFARGLRSTPDGVYVALDVGFRLTALVVRRAVEELRIRRGTPLFAIVKATAVVPEATVRPAIRASVIGPRGTIGPEHVDLLRAISLLGSLVAAAREVRITYRTAWAWARAINGAWGAPIVAGAHGGKGGGGSTLTPEGRALLESVAQFERSATCLVRR